MKYTASYLIEKLNLKLHPEGGYYAQIYKDPSIIKKIGLQNNFDGDRSCSTAIYYLLYEDRTSVFHKIKSDEVWHYYSGNTNLKIYEIKPNGILRIHNLGNDIDNNEAFVCIIEKNSWFAAELNYKNDDNFALVGCTVAPGFEFRDYKIGDFEDLKKKFPQHIEIIKKLTQK